MNKLLLSALLLSAAAGTAAAQVNTLKTVRDRGHLQCSGHVGAPGFSYTDSKGEWRGLDVDMCKGIAAAIFGEAKVKFTPLTSQARLTALQSGEIDVLSRSTTWTLQRDTVTGLTFTATTFYDGQAFMVPTKLGVKSVKDLNGATICVSTGTTTELNLADYFRANNLTFKAVIFENNEETRTAYYAGRCDAYTSDFSQLASVRMLRSGDPNEHMLLPELISKEPLGVAVRKGDGQWFDIVRWTIFALIEAEELGITQANAEEMLKSPNPAVQRLLGVNVGNGKALGLDERWAFNAIKAVGNYGEIFERNVGEQTPMKLKRGVNALWTKGGLMYAIPLR